MKKEIVIPLTLESLLAAEEALDANPELEITIMAMNYGGFNQALACYDYSRTMDCINRLKIVFCSERVSVQMLVAVAAFPLENRIVMPHVNFKQSKFTSGAYGNQNDIVSGREYYSQIKTAVSSILLATYGIESDFLEKTAKQIPAIETGFFSKYVFGGEATEVGDLDVDVDGDDVNQTEGDYF